MKKIKANICGLLGVFMLCNFFSVNAQTTTETAFDLSELKKNKASVLIFFDIECPICQKYTKTIREFEQKFEKDNIKFYLVYSPQVIDNQAIADFREEYKLDTRLIPDSKHILVKKFGATTTPEVFLVDSSLKTQYSGAIDDWFYALGKSKASPKEHYLADALNEYLKGEKIKIKKSKPIGCLI